MITIDVINNFYYHNHNVYNGKTWLIETIRSYYITCQRNRYGNYLSDRIISSWLRFFVSGKTKITNMAEPIQTPENKNMLPWKLITSINNWRYLMQMNERIHNNDMQNETLVSLIFSGMVSLMTINGNVRMPKDATKITNDRLVTGIQLNASTSTPQDRTII